MFCSKCGKELPEGAVFCPSCGGSVNGTNPTQPKVPPSPVNYGSANSGISAEEKNKKLVAIAAFILCAVMNLFFYWSIVISKGSIIFGDYINHSIWGDSENTFFTVVSVLMTLGSIILAFTEFLLPYINRTFDKKRATVKGSLVPGFFLAGPMSVILAYKANKHCDYIPIVLLVLGISVSALAIIVAITYSAAAYYERYQITKEKEATLKYDEIISPNGKRYATNLARISGETQEEYWICPECGTRNRLLSDQCKDCGHYK